MLLRKLGKYCILLLTEKTEVKMAYLSNNDNMILPMIALRGIVVYPEMMVNFEIGRRRSIEAVEEAMRCDRRIFLLTQRDMREADPSCEDLYDIGTVARIRQVIKLPGGNVRAIVEGLFRAECVSLLSDDSIAYTAATIRRLNDTEGRSSELYRQALVRKVRESFAEYAQLIPKLPPDIIAGVMQTDEPGRLADYITSNINIPVDDKQYILEQLNSVKRLKEVAALLVREREILGIDAKINETVKEQMDANQRDYYLREQLKAISDELYGAEDPQTEFDSYMEKISALAATDEIKEKLREEASRLAKMPAGSQEAAVSRSYLDLCLSLPFGKYSSTVPDINKSRRLLDKEHYGLERVKERILETVAVHTLVPDIRGQIICLVGPPGVGKTSIAKSIAACLGRSYARVSLGGVSDEAEIRGHRKTYIGSMPGRIITAVKTAGTQNPLILLDEIDKLSTTAKGDPAAALLETLDSEQNVAFYDHYVDLPFDLSRVLFVTTANSLDTVPAPLLDRMEIIELGSYTREEKFKIARLHLIKKAVPEFGLTAGKCRFTDEAVYTLIDSYTREAGVRRLKRLIESAVRKVGAEIVSGKCKSVTISAAKLKEYFGPEKYTDELIPEVDSVGLVNGLAWTSVGGTMMQLETVAVKGTGKIELTGSLGDVMRESAHTAVTYVRSIAESIGVDPDFYKNTDLHIHATEAAVPKDGPSAGVTMVTAIVSALTGIPVKRDIAMTGEVSLHGKSLIIGGLREKTMAAYKAGVKTVFIPAANVRDMRDIDETVKQNVRIVPVDSVEEILHSALVSDPFEAARPVSVNIGGDKKHFASVRQ